MGVVVAFNYAAWIALFPEFTTTVDESAANALVGTVAIPGPVTTFVRNDGGGPVSTAATQTQLINYCLAHLAFLYYGTNAQPAAQTVGRINSAAEGSVNVQLDYGNNVGQQMAFWIQSRYGATFWAMSAPYRTARYIVGRNNLGLVGPPLGGPWLTGGIIP
jgi:hypothetical protein